MLNKGQILAHRGAWTGIDGKPIFEKNSLEAIRRAALLGFGLETDIRDLDGKLVISHDPPSTGALNIDELARVSFRGPKALNIKSDGLSPMLQGKIESGALTGECFFFDMSIPEEVRFARAGITFASRISELEKRVSPQASWIWLDGFESDWYLEKPEILLEYAGKLNLAIVSPELHGRSTELAWPVIAKLMHASKHVHLCTDLPEKFIDLFGGLGDKP